MRLQIRVRPGARETRIIGWEEGVLQLSVHAPARDGQANRAVTELVAQTLGVPKSAVALHRGARGRDKSAACRDYERRGAAPAAGRAAH